MTKNNKQFQGGDLIESVMGRATAGAPPVEAPASAADPLEARFLWRREQDRVLNLRLEQLQTALGRERPLAPATATLDNPGDSAALPLFATQGSSRAHRSGALLLTVVVAALSGAVVTWLMMGSHGQTHDRGALSAMLPAPVAQSFAVVPIPAVAAAPLTPAADDGVSQVRDVVQGWRQAWSRRDIDAYLGYYSPDFLPADGQARAVWAQARRDNLARRSDISVTVSALRIEPLGDDRIKVLFLQDYASGRYRESARPKTLLLVRTQGDWKIAGEWQGPHPALPVIARPAQVGR